MQHARTNLPVAIKELQRSAQFHAWGKPTLRIDNLETSAVMKEVAEKHYTPAELAEMWKVSVDVVRRVFRDEPGVLKIGDKNPKHKQQYLTLRIPESVVERVHRRLSA